MGRWGDIIDQEARKRAPSHGKTGFCSSLQAVRVPLHPVYSGVGSARHLPSLPGGLHGSRPDYGLSAHHGGAASLLGRAAGRPG